MFKVERVKKFLKSDLAWLFFLSALYTAIYNFYLLRIEYRSLGPWQFVPALLASLFLIFQIHLLLSLNRWLFVIGTIILYNLSSIAAYFIFNYQITITQDSISYFFETDPHEALGFVGYYFVLWVVLNIALAVFGTGVFLRLRQTGNRTKILVSLVLCLFFIAVPYIRPFMPYTIVQSTISYFREIGRLSEFTKNRPPFPDLPVSCNKKESVVVLVIGESARPDHFSINGYFRNTSPNLEKSGAVSYPDAWAYRSATEFTIPCILTGRCSGSEGKPVLDYSLMSYFRRAGFITAWISNQGYLNRFNTYISVFAKEADTVVYANRSGSFSGILKVYDESLFPHVEDQLAKRASRKLIVLHTIGSHWSFEAHYPDAFRKFRPVCTNRRPLSCDRNEVLNSYDNSILYTDFFLGELFKRLKDMNALVLFVSDHGESLGEKDLYNHGHPDPVEHPEQFRTALFVWASPEFAAVNPGMMACCRRNRLRHWRHDVIFHSLLDAAGIGTPAMDPGKSIFRQN
jgi:glucan phosphoethanolaminetransferase (alkaline phosphatase superfamily)